MAMVSDQRKGEGGGGVRGAGLGRVSMFICVGLLSRSMGRELRLVDGPRFELSTYTSVSVYVW